MFMEFSSFLKSFRSFLFLSLFLFIGIEAFAQVRVSINQTAAQLVQTLVGSGVTTLNPVLSCPTDANGIFKVTSSNLGIKGGIILCTGYAASAVGPASYLADFSNSSRGDEDLSALSGQVTYDACKLEFDFIPTGETVKFRYVFGSEEYPSFACTQYNDVFAFYIYGPEYPTHKNIALIPGTNIPVAINSTAGIVGTSGGKISICEAMGKGSPFKEYYVNNSNGTTITYNGFTKVFTAAAAVTPCATYHLKLAIADAKDHQYDSGVFIEEGSLSSNTLSVSLQDNLQTPVPYCVRACKNGSFIFKRKYSSSLPLTIHYLIGGTAINGKDYKKIPDSVIIPAYDTIFTRVITPLRMSAATGPKTIKLYVYSPFSCGAGKSVLDSSQLTIYDSLYAIITTPNTLICNGHPVQMDVIGENAFIYNWTPQAGLNDPNIKKPVALPSNSTTYTLTTSFLSCPPIVSHVRINLPDGPLLLGSNAPCEGGILKLSSNKISGAVYKWRGPNSFTSDLQNPSIPNVSIADSGTYTLSLIYPGCNVKGTVHAKINASPFITNQPADATVCSGTDASFAVSARGLELAYQWQVDKGSGFSDILNSGKYSGTNTGKLKISNPDISMNGYNYQCILSGTCTPPVTSTIAKLTVSELPSILSQSHGKIVCSGNNTSFSVSANGKNLKYQWQISNNGTGFSDIMNSSLYNGAATNKLLITNASESMSGYLYRCLISGGCGSSIPSKIDTLVINKAPLINKNTVNITVCADENARFSVSATGTKLTYQWKVNEGYGFKDIVDEGVYSGARTNMLNISKASGNMNAYQYQCRISGVCEPALLSQVATLTVNTKPLITKAPSNSSICVGGHTSFSVAVTGGNLSYKWSVNAGNGFVPVSNGTIYNGAASNTLTVTRANRSFSGHQYQCYISGDCEPPLITSPVKLTVDSLPVISVQPSGSTVCAGSNVSFSISATGPGLSYQWQLSTGSLFNDISDTGNYSGTKSSNGW